MPAARAVYLGKVYPTGWHKKSGFSPGNGKGFPRTQVCLLLPALC